MMTEVQINAEKADLSFDLDGSIYSENAGCYVPAKDLPVEVRNKLEDIQRRTKELLQEGMELLRPFTGMDTVRQ